jgi:hypothetical protein
MMSYATAFSARARNRVPLVLCAAGVAILCHWIFAAPICFAQEEAPSATPESLAFAAGTFEGWEIEGDNTWSIGQNPPLFTNTGDAPRFVVNSLEKGEACTGTLRSKPFVIEKARQSFSVGGWDGTANGRNDADRSFVLLRSYPDGEILRRTHTPGGNKLVPSTWESVSLLGRRVYVEVVDSNPRLNPGGFAWIAFADYRQTEWDLLKNPVMCDNLSGLDIDEKAERLLCRTIPFLAAEPGKRGKTTRLVQGGRETIAVGTTAETIYLLGMINHGWDMGLAHWGEHPELREVRVDQIFIGSRIGDLEIRYEGGVSDKIPLVMGKTAWFVRYWAGASPVPPQEPFASRPEYMEQFRRCLKLKESPNTENDRTACRHYFLAIKPRDRKIESLVIHDNPALRGGPLVTAVTLAGAEPVDGIAHFGPWCADASDLEPVLRSEDPGDWTADLDALAEIVYTKESDLPATVDLLEFPEELNAARIRFQGDVKADMLSNIWVANLTQIAEKFERETGFFHESGKDYPWYGSYHGIGTWAPLGVYYSGAFGRCSDHFVTLALRCIDDPVRVASYVDFVDKYFYHYRDNHDPEKGPPNPHHDVDRYPADAPSHWGFVIQAGGPPWQINEIAGDEETDGHGATMVGRWVAWRTLGAPSGEWLTAPREEVFGKSRWDVTRDAAEFLCWLMDYTGMDVMWCEGETTGWGGKAPWGMRLTGVDNWPEETDPEKIRKNYANANMYEVYPTYVCLTALRCSAEIADAAEDTESAKKWRAYADRLESGMIRLLAVGEHGSMHWKQARFSVYPSLQDNLVQAWFSIYYDGLDPQRLHQEMTGITRNTLRRQLDLTCGRKPVLAMGYGIGWLTKAALILDEMDDAGPMLINIARYTYDKNMNFVDEARGIDWRKFQWMVPEGTNILPDGRWYRIGDLTNGANQGPALHALELCAGIDDTRPAELKILPRVPDPLTGLDVTDFPVLVPDGAGLTRAKINYRFVREPLSFSLESDIPLPTLAVRLGPFAGGRAARDAARKMVFPAGSTHRFVNSGRCGEGAAWWIWIEGMTRISSLVIE